MLAEGVETLAQLHIVRECGVDAIQGWYYAKAMPLAEALEFAAKPEHATACEETRSSVAQVS